MNRDIMFNGVRYRINIDDGGNCAERFGEALFKEMKTIAQKNKVSRSPGGPKLLSGTARYLGWRHEAWSDDSYYEIQYSGEWSQTAAANLYRIMPRNMSFCADTAKKRILFCRCSPIGD